MLDIREDTGGVTIRVRVQPRASKNQLAGEMDGALKVRLAAPPVDGAANRSCCEFIAGLLGVAKTRVEIVHGHTGRNKTVRVAGITAVEARDRLKY
ncbi:MAG: hypothetical protein JL56_01940 [Desulfotomaculum sp. BICA1-6]|nr:MAG: hypothetical protein VR67_13490 [Peptococcaceae bacterium BRH_c8a]KJS77990.1 MAG: hypothetical protein JL56_01940 [Desulfotomaculum sp. BICA1-6]